MTATAVTATPGPGAYAAVPMGRAREFGSVRHLTRRFLSALSPAGPSPTDEAWALGWLLPGEQRLWHRMSGPDRRHAVRVARDALARLGDGGPPVGRAVAASALMHDVGKVEADLGTVRRALVTAAAMVVGRSRLGGPPTAAAGGGAELAGWRRRVQLYLTHDRVGAALLRGAGSDPLTVSWAAEHHQPADRWTVDRRVADALKAADGD